MPKSIYAPAVRDEILTRIDRLAPDAPARWGKFDAPRMVSHLIDSARMPLGEIDIARRGTFLSTAFMRWLVIYVMPFPKGAPTAPQLLKRAPESWDADRARLKELISRCATLAGKSPMPHHAAFGDMTAKDWGVLVYRHTDHHLKQFGV